MPPREKGADQARPNVACSASDKDIHVSQTVRSFAQRASGQCPLPSVWSKWMRFASSLPFP